MFPSLQKYSFTLLLALATLTSYSQSVGGTTSGAASYCTASNSGFVSVTGYTGTILNWESSVNGGTTWSNIGNVTPNQSYFNLTQTTCYRAIVKNGAFPIDSSSVSCITIYQPTVPGSLSMGGTFCGGSGAGTINLTGNTGSVLNWQYSTDGGSTWTIITNTTTAQSYTNITQNTIYEAVVQNSSFCATDTSSQSTFIINPVSFAGTISQSGNDTVCASYNNEVLTLSGSVGQITTWLYSTNNGATWTPITNTTTTQSFSNITQNTLYEAVVQSSGCAADTSPSLSITVVPLPSVNAGIDSIIASGQSLTLNGAGTGTPLWIPSSGLSNPTIFTPVATPSVTTAYILAVSNTFGCINADTVLISVMLPVFTGTVSNYFTPNGDGINDSWYIQNIQNYPANEVFVYNIYGNEVYNQKAYVNDWKGTYSGGDLPDGTYYYVVRFDNSDKILKGSLDILRKK